LLAHVLLFWFVQWSRKILKKPDILIKEYFLVNVMRRLIAKPEMDLDFSFQQKPYLNLLKKSL